MKCSQVDELHSATDLTFLAPSLAKLSKRRPCEWLGGGLGAGGRTTPVAVGVPAGHPPLHSFGEQVERVSDAAPAAVEDVRVDHGGLDAPVAEELLDGPDVVSILDSAEPLRAD